MTDLTLAATAAGFICRPAPELRSICAPWAQSERVYDAVKGRWRCREKLV